jgi:hypothetical protein
MGRKAQSVSQPYLSLQEVLHQAKSSLDREVKVRLYESLGERIYKTWFYNTNFTASGIKNLKPEFYILNPFFRNYVITHFSRQINAAFGIENNND